MPASCQSASSPPQAKRARLSPPPASAEIDATNSPSDTSDSAVTPADSHIDHSRALAYWSSTPATVSGVLGGYPALSRTDVQGSANFLAKVRRARKELAQREGYPAPSEKLRRVADCGAGIGRISVGLLAKVATRVDVIEPVKSFCDVVRQEGVDGGLKGRLGRVWEVGLEGWRGFEHGDDGRKGDSATGGKESNGDAEEQTADSIPDTQRYDLIWNQWCLGQLTDKQLTDYLARSITWLSPGGLIVVKENLSNHFMKMDVFDETDSSVTRSVSKFEDIFKQAGLRTIKTELQTGFPKELFPVRMWALVPE